MTTDTIAERTTPGWNPRRTGSTVAGKRRQRGKGDGAVPFVNVKVIAGVFTVQQRRVMVALLTDTSVAVEGETMRQVTWLVIEEVKNGGWGIGSHALSTADVEALAAAQPQLVR